MWTRPLFELSPLGHFISIQSRSRVDSISGISCLRPSAVCGVFFNATKGRLVGLNGGFYNPRANTGRVAGIYLYNPMREGSEICGICSVFGVMDMK